MPKPKRVGLSISALARAFRRDRRTIAATVEDLEPIGQDGVARLYFLPDVEKRLADRAGSADLRRAVLRKLNAEAMKLEHRVAEKRTELVPIADTVSVVGEAFVAARAKWLAVPSKYGPIMTPAMTEAESRAVLDRAVREVLDELVADALARAAMGDA